MGRQEDERNFDFLATLVSAGFKVPEKLDGSERSLYHRLVQVPWHPRMILEGHTGSHLGTTLPGSAPVPF